MSPVDHSLTMIGRRLSHYRILEPLGEGGMGVVYRAWDEHLEREVAVKLLPEDTLADESARKRFRREALDLSRLNHPHINTVYDFDCQEGVDFIVMELVAGETVERRLRRGPLTEMEVRRVGAQIASALSAAHEHGIVHRDLKPANVIIGPRGDAKVLDFGIAKRPPALGGGGTTTLTEMGALVGTLPYMAPEQVLGQDIDHRADLFALGAVLYEMATSLRPFREETAMALANAIVNQVPEPPRSMAPELSAYLESIILKCLEKAPKDRYSSANDVIQALTAPHPDLETRTGGVGESRDPAAVAATSGAKEETAGGARAATRAKALEAASVEPALPPQRHESRRVGFSLAAVVLTIGAILFVLMDPFKLRERFKGPEGGKTIAVLPLENLSRDPDQEFFVEGMTEELTTALSKISALTVIAPNSVRSARENRLSLSELGHKLHVAMLVQGAVARAGERVRVNASLIEVSSGRLQWSDSYARNLRDVLDMQSDLALAIAREIQVRLTAAERSRLSRNHPVDPQVHEQYLLGLHYLARASAEEQSKAIAHFERATAIDPNYAPAFAATASAYERLSTWWLSPRVAMPKARAAAERALVLDPDLAEAHAVLGMQFSQHDWRFLPAVQELERAVSLNPSSAEARLYLGYVLNQIGRFSESREHLTRAVQLDPLNSFYRFIAVWPLYYSGRYAETTRELEALIRDDPKFADSFTLLGETYERTGDYAQTLTHLKHARELGMHAWGLAAIGRVYAEMGQRDSASAIIGQLESSTDSAYVSPYGTATIYAALGERDRAFALLDRAISERSEDVPLIKIDPRLGPLHGDRRFAVLVSRVGLE